MVVDKLKAAMEMLCKCLSVKGKIRIPPKPHINSYQHSNRITELLNSTGAYRNER
jgi:hypothetical protein